MHDTAADWAEVYRASRYAFPFQGEWLEFTLRGERAGLDRLDRSVTLITAWNPDSVDHSAAWNTAANLRLTAALEQAQVEHRDAWGASLPGVEPAWRESGFAVLGWSQEQAAAWGRKWSQRAVVWLDSEASLLLFCASGEALACGMEILAGGQA